MSVFVKICGLRDAECIAAAVNAGADAVGFVFAESVRRITPEEARRIASAVPATVKRVAVMRHPSNDEWRSVLDVFAPDVLQTDAEDLRELDVPANVATWPVVREGGRQPDEMRAGVFVYEGANSGTGETVDWTRAREAAQTGRMLLAGGLTAGNVAEAMAITRPWGVDTSSGVESRRGVKDAELIRQFINAVRTAEKDG